ncbi:MAG: metal ABC transporter permease, partial [Cyanobacteriota bacterium]|nr:metal ABC transporter permease [Cyanobacteriota bacterium]
GATAYLLSDRFDQMLAISVGTSVLSCVLGVYFSYHLDVSTGGCIVVCLTLLFAIAAIFAPKYGLLAQSPRSSAG